jgi:hypothetical protein
MPLSQQQLEKVRSWLHSPAFTIKCPACGSRDLGIKDLVRFPAFDPNTWLETPFVALAALICAHCA